MDLIHSQRKHTLVVRPSATTIAAGIRQGSLSARDVVAGAIKLAKAQQPELNITTFIDEEAAIERAERIDLMVQNDTDPGPLAGVPIALKDLIDHAGRPTTCGSAWYREVPQRSATIVESLEQAGAVIIARTGLHEFAYGFSSENEWFGPVRNPLDPALSPGGSSGGSAAAVSAGQVPIAIGTDTGGSVRVPAALCGVFGLKVTHGRVPLTGVFPLAASLDTVGPIAGSVDDLTLAYTVIATYDEQDPWSRAQPVFRPGSRPDLRGVKVGLPVRWLDGAAVTDQVASSFASAVGRIRDLGASVGEIDDPELAPPGKILELASAEAARVHRVWMQEGREYGSDVRERLERGMTVGVDDYLDAQIWRSRLQQRTAAAFGQYDLIVTPATAATRKVIGVDTINTLSGDVFYRGVLSWFSALVNSMGVPALVGPLAESGHPPVGLQAVAPWWQEHRLLEFAKTLETSGGLTCPPTWPS